MKRALELMTQAGLQAHVSIGIKRLLSIIEMARQDVDKVEKFVEALRDESTKHILVANNGRI
jgi:vesicle-fusing ATPase